MASKYGTWGEQLNVDGQSWRADLIEQAYAERAGFDKIYAIDGLPECYLDSVARASQVCDVPHSWRVHEVASESEVSDEILQRARLALKNDQRDYNAIIFTYVGARDDAPGEYEFLAAGAIRNKLTRDFESNEFLVVSRAIVAPAHRGKGIGSLIVEHRQRAVHRYFGEKPKAIHFGTESEKVLHITRRVEKAENVVFVHIGDEQLEVFDGVHTVHDYMCYLPWYQQSLSAFCDDLKKHISSPEQVEDFSQKLMLFCTEGVKSVSGAELEASFREIANSLEPKRDSTLEVKKGLEAIEEFFFVKKKIGACDPS